MMDASLYHPLFFGFFCLWGAIIALRYGASQGQRLIASIESSRWGWLCAIIVAFWIGMRPTSGIYFGDMFAYANMYKNFSGPLIDFDIQAEWLWDSLKAIGHLLHLTTDQYFVFIALLYTLTAFATMRILIPKKPLTSLVLVGASLMFFAFATNGLRNGLACHFTMLAFALYLKDQRIIGILLAFLAYGIHHSVGVPIIAFALSLFVYKRPQLAIYLWILSIVASLLLGNSLTSFIEQLSFDERLSHYTNMEQGGVGIQFSTYGFRLDFLLYSAMPIALGY